MASSPPVLWRRLTFPSGERPKAAAESQALCIERTGWSRAVVIAVDHRTVTAVLEEPTCIPARDRVQRPALLPLCPGRLPLGIPGAIQENYRVIVERLYRWHRALKALKPDEYEDLQPRSDVFHSALEIVSDRSLEAHGFALSSVVVNARSGIPGSGFFDAAISRWHLPNAQKVHSREGIDPEPPGYRMWNEQASQAIKHYNR